MERRYLSALAPITLAALLAVFWTAPVLAQEAAPPEGGVEAAERATPEGIEEIVVTATKRETILQDTPAAITAFNTSNFQDMNIETGGDYQMFVPSVSLQAFPPRLAIRGVGRDQNSLGLDPGVAVYRDGMYRDSVASLYAGHFGTERIEILRGPQGTLYGRNAVGGAVNFITQRPEDEFHVEAQLKLASYQERNYGIIMTGPISEWLRYHFTIEDFSRDSYTENIGGRDGRAVDQRNYRAQIELDLSDNMSFWVKWERANGHFETAGGNRLVPRANCCQLSQLSTSAIHGYDPGFEVPGTRDPHYVENSPDALISVRLQNTWSITTQFDWDLGPVGLKYMYGQQTYDWNWRHSDLDGTLRTDPFVINHFGQVNIRPGGNEYHLFIREDKQYYQHELQLTSQTDSRLQWIAGVFFYHEEIEQPFTTFKRFQEDLQNICLSCLPPDSRNEPDPEDSDPLSRFSDPIPRHPFLRFIPFGPIDFGFFDYSVVVPNVSNAGGNPAAVGVHYHQEGKLKTDAWAVYAEAYYDLTERLKLTFGLRHSRDRRHAEEYQIQNGDPWLFGLDYPGVGPIADLFLPGFGAPVRPENCCMWQFSNRQRRLRDRWDSLSARLVLDYKLTDESLVYASVSQGYKAGGFRLGSFTSLSVDPKFDQEDMTAYEVGYKSTFFDRRLLVNLASYYYDYEDHQVLRNFLDETAGITHAHIVNAPEAELFGAEIELRALLTDQLSMHFAYSYNHAEFESFCCSWDSDNPDLDGDFNPGLDGVFDFVAPFSGDGAGPGDLQDLKGNDLPQAPENKFSIGFMYSWYTDWGTFSIHPIYSWIDKQTYNIFNNSYAPSYHRSDLVMRWIHPENKWQVILYGKNLEDEDNFNSYNLSGVPLTACSPVQDCPRAPLVGSTNKWVQGKSGGVNQPRTFGIEILYRY